MFDAFKTRRPWAAGLITLLFGPEIGMCYLNRGGLALLYLAALLVWVSIFMKAEYYGILNIYPTYVISIELILRAIGVIHSVSIARKPSDFNLEKRRWYCHWYSLLLFVIAFVSTTEGFRQFVYEPFDLTSASMSPNLNADDYLWVEKFAYNKHMPERGDVIVFKNIKRHNADFIKRVIGLPGDKIQIKTGVLYINNTPVPQKKYENFILRDNKGEHSIPQFAEVLPEGKQYKVLVENTNAPVENTIAYIVPEHNYFVLGDNRDHSLDSRDLKEAGFVFEASIIGKVIVIWWDGRQGKLDPRPVN